MFVYCYHENLITIDISWLQQDYFNISSMFKTTPLTWKELNLSGFTSQSLIRKQKNAPLPRKLRQKNTVQWYDWQRWIFANYYHHLYFFWKSSYNCESSFAIFFSSLNENYFEHKFFFGQSAIHIQNIHKQTKLIAKAYKCDYMLFSNIFGTVEIELKWIIGR